MSAGKTIPHSWAHAQTTSIGSPSLCSRIFWPTSWSHQSASHGYPTTGIFCEDPKFRVYPWYNCKLHHQQVYLWWTQNMFYPPNHPTTFPLISLKRHFCYGPEISGLLQQACFRYVKQPFPPRTRNFGSTPRSLILIRENSHLCFGPEISGLPSVASL